MSYLKFTKTFIISAATFSMLAACTGDKIKTEAKYPSGLDRNQTGNDIYGERETIWGKGGGIGILNGKKKDDGTSIGVNAHLWRASLDTISFMPLASADPFGGTILTDWYTAPETPNERFKLNVFILSKQLRSDGVRVRVFKQIKQGANWVDSETPAAMGTELEDAILTRARQLRVASLKD